MEIIKVNNLKKNFGKEQVLKGISLSFDENVVNVLIGPSGSGKTTLLRLVAGLEKPDSGEIYISYIRVNSPSILIPPKKRGISMVFQNLALWPHMTVKEHLLFVMKAKKVSKQIVQDKVAQMVHLIGLESLVAKYPSQLSGGERQRLAIARALVPENPILFLDEPVSHLHPVLKKEILHLIKKLKNELELTLVYVTHRADEALFMGEKIFFLDGGVLKYEGNTREIKKNRDFKNFFLIS